METAAVRKLGPVTLVTLDRRAARNAVAARTNRIADAPEGGNRLADGQDRQGRLPS